MLRFFDDEFIKKCESKLPQPSERSVLFYSQQCADLLKKMKQLRCDDKGVQLKELSGSESFESKAIRFPSDREVKLPIKEVLFAEQTEYEFFLKEIIATQEWCAKHERLGVVFCKNLLTDVTTYVHNRWPDLSLSLVRQAESDDHRIDEHKLIQSCNRCGMFCCCVWGLVQNTVTLFNVCRHKAISLEQGDIHLCDSLSSIKSLCADNDARAQDIVAMKMSSARIHWLGLKEYGLDLGDPGPRREVMC